jgi:hypothetical protein
LPGLPAAAGPSEPAAQPVAAEPVLPEQTVDDTDAGWGEGGDRGSGNDQRLLDERPPHWE